MTRLEQRYFSARTVVLAVAAWMVLFCNYSFFSHVLGAYPLTPANFAFIASLAVLLLAVTVLLLAPFTVGRALQPLLIGMLLLASMTAYFMDSYQVIISSEVIESTLQTDSAESTDLLSLKLALYLGVMGILPAILVYRARIRQRPLRATLLSHLKLGGASLLVIVAVLGLFGNAYASFFRVHKSVRYYTNPVTPVYTALRYASDTFANHEDLPHQQIGLDAQLINAPGERRLMVLVVGETARADHFALNGYPRNTNPRLSGRRVASFDNVWSCGTATSVSVPCMFSALDQGRYHQQQARSMDNVLDILQRAGVNVLWLDNNSDSKGVALRIPYVSYRDEKVNPVCDAECRDEGMLAGVRQFVSDHPTGSILVVLHQMGSHGPKYARGYPTAFEHFSPSCQSNLLEDCSEGEINNAYDNSIRYTDCFLDRVIDYLESLSGEFSTAMLYLSDHGESLGENGIFLHGFPYALAPEEQKHIPMIFWSDPGNARAQDKLADRNFVHQRFTQDNLFHTLLGLMDVKTEVYQSALDIFANG
jgi:lipid A ethanolaminephosphotransferase